MKGVEKQLPFLPSGSLVTVTCSPAKGMSATLELCELVVRAGHYVVPHLSARMIESEFVLKSVLRRLDGMGVTEAFVVGGDRVEPAGPYADGYSLLRAIRGCESGLQVLGTTSYPEGHPSIPDEVLLRDLLRKQHLADYAVTQICFQSDRIVAWLAEVRAQGFLLPVYAGIPGVVDLARLLKISAAIGVGDSLRFLRKNLAAVTRLARGYRADALVRGVESVVEGYHIYTFNRVDPTEQWRQELLAA